MFDVLHVPAVCLESFRDIFGKSDLGVTICTLSVIVRYAWTRALTNRDLVVIVDSNEVTELQVASSRSCFRGNTFHSTAITEEHESVIVDQVISWLVEDGSSMLLRNCETNCVCKTLTKRTCGNLDTWCVVSLWVTWANAVDCLDMISARFLLKGCQNLL